MESEKRNSLPCYRSPTKITKAARQEAGLLGGPAFLLPNGAMPIPGRCLARSGTAAGCASQTARRQYLSALCRSCTSLGCEQGDGLHLEPPVLAPYRSSLGRGQHTGFCFHLGLNSPADKIWGLSLELLQNPTILETLTVLLSMCKPLGLLDTLLFSLIMDNRTSC